MSSGADRSSPDLTARQLAILAVAAVVLWVGYTATRHLGPARRLRRGCAPVGLAGARLLALGRFEGVAADRWVAAAWRHHRAPHRLVPSPDGVPARASPWLRSRPVHCPPRCASRSSGSAADGIVDLGADGLALVCRASAVTFALRTPTEQEALVAGFAVLELARRARRDPRPGRAGRPQPRPSSALPRRHRRAPAPRPWRPPHARHAGSSPSWPSVATSLAREVLVVLRQTTAQDAAGRLHRRAAEAAAALGAAG